MVATIDNSGGLHTVEGAGARPRPRVWCYEAGLKLRLAEGRAGLSLAAFHTDHTDRQVQTILQPGVLEVANAAAASIRGFEGEGRVELAGALQAGGQLAWLDARYDRYLAVVPGGGLRDVAGNRLDNAPLWSGCAWLQWTRPAGRAGTLSLRADARWQSAVFFTPFNDSVERQSPYDLLNLSAELGSKRWSVGAYARNLTNEGYVTTTSSFPPPAIGGRPGEPRELGVQLVFTR